MGRTLAWSVVAAEAEQWREESEKEPSQQAVEKQGKEGPEKIEGRITQLACDSSEHHQDDESSAGSDGIRCEAGTSHTWPLGLGPGRRLAGGSSAEEPEDGEHPAVVVAAER